MVSNVKGKGRARLSSGFHAKPELLEIRTSNIEYLSLIALFNGHGAGFFMFGRANKLTHVCLRCQRRILRPDQRWNNLEGRGFDQRLFRLQSTAAARIEDDDDHPEPLPRTESAESIETSKAQAKQYRNKRWRPAPSAELGMNALGKPSEILILSQRDREIPVVPTETDQETQETVHDSITSEKQPISWEQIKANINQARKQVGQQRGQLTLAQWNDLQTVLHGGFTNSQLKRYMNETWSRTPSESAALKLGDKKRAHIVQLIATKVWGYELPDAVVASLPKPEENSKRASAEAKTVTLKSKVREALVPSLQLRIRGWTQKFGVQISLQQAKISIKGIKANVAEASKSIRKYRGSLICSRISNDPWMARFGHSPWAEMADGLVETLRSKYRLHVQVERQVVKGKRKLRFSVWHPSEDGEKMLQIRHALRTAVAPSARTSPPWMALYVPAASGNAKLIRVPCHAKTALPQDGMSQHYRLYAAKSSDKKSQVDAKVAQSADKASTAVEQVLLPAAPAALSEDSMAKVYSEYSASFGLALFGHKPEERAAFLEAPKKPHVGYPIFMSEPVLVPQLLSHPRFQNTANTSISVAVDASPRSLLRMSLSPNHLTTWWPRFELLLRGPDPAAESTESLAVAQVTAVFEEISYLVPRPDQAVDIKFARLTKCQLFDIQSPTTLQYPAIVEALREYIGDGKSQLSLFTKLTLPPNFAQLKADEAKKTKLGKSTAHSVEYVLDSMEVVDVDARLAPALSTSPERRYPVEHITCHGRQVGSDGQELVLRHVQTGTEQVDLKHFVKTAVDVGDRIDALGRQVRHRMEGYR